MGVKEDYLFRRNGKGNYYLRLQFPKWTGRCEVRTSLGTPDYRNALELSQGAILRHRLTLASMAEFARERLGAVPLELWSTTSSRLYEDGEHIQEDGSRVIVAQGMSIRIRPDGTTESFENVKTTKLHPFTRDSLRWVLAHKDLPEFSSPELTNMPLVRPDETLPRLEDFGPEPGAPKTKPTPKPAGDELTRLVEVWIEGKKRSKHIANEARGVLAVWHEISGGKAIRDARREDGKKLREHLFAIGNKLPTVQKKIGHLRAALKYAALEDVYNGPNPFTALITSDIKKLKKRQSVAGKPFTEEDMAKVRASLADWDDPDAKLLWVLCATTGMRRGEAYLIEGEQVLAGNLRCITLIPTNEDDTIKNDESERMIPIPADAIPFLPAKITGRLFEGGTLTVGGRKLARDRVSVGKRLLRHLKNLGVLGRGKNLRSTRHRAAQRMKNARLPNGTICPPDLRREVLGHEFEDVHDGVYARGYPMSMLKEWMDQIGLGPTDRIS